MAKSKTHLDRLALELLGLPTASRALIAERLIASLDDRADDRVEAAWIREASRRCGEIREKKVKTRPLSEFLKEARKKLK